MVFIKSIAAGIMIGIACIISISINNPIASPILFSIGLFIICLRGYNLYTGKVGYIKTKTDVKNIFIILLGNFIGILLICLIKPLNTIDAVMLKLFNPWYITFFYSVLCGLLMYIAVDTFKKGNPLGIICAVPAFIICGFEHSIADMYYFICAGYSFINRGYHILSAGSVIKAVLTLGLIIIGNAVGANLHHIIKEKK